MDLMKTLLFHSYHQPKVPSNIILSTIAFVLMESSVMIPPIVLNLLPHCWLLEITVVLVSLAIGITLKVVNCSETDRELAYMTCYGLLFQKSGEAG